jgi:putative oxidoreductase
MECLNKKLDQIFNNLTFITPWLLRLSLGVSFIFHGYGKFPLPPQKLIDYFGFSETLASFVAISELTAGILLILGGFIKSHLGELVTRFGSVLIVIIMIVALGLAHRDWFITPKLFMSEQIFLLIIGLYFLIRGNK